MKAANPATTRQGGPSQRVDVVALVSGLLLSGVAVAALWLAFTGSIDWQLVKVIAPLILVISGIVGLALSRNRE